MYPLEELIDEAFFCSPLKYSWYGFWFEVLTSFPEKEFLPKKTVYSEMIRTNGGAWIDLHKNNNNLKLEIT